MKLALSFNFLRNWFSDWRAYFAEFLGTFLFVLVSQVVVLVDKLYANVGNLSVALSIGFAYTALVYVTAHLSGGYLNPALTVALWLGQRLSGAKATFFLIGQILASFLAVGVLFLLFGESAVKFKYGLPDLGLNITLSTAVISEAIFSAGLVFALYSTMVDRHGPVSFGPMVLGLYLLAASIVLVPISGAVLNPARVLGPSIISGAVEPLAVWVIGPLTGSLFAIVYEYVFLRKGKR